MNRLALWIFGLLIALLAGSASCGSPSLAYPDFLLVTAFLPSEGAGNIGVEVEPGMHFSDAVDPSSVTASSFFLESADGDVVNMECEPDNREPCDCDPWEIAPRVEGERVVDGSRLIFKPNSDLETDRCYRLTCTTEIRGMEKGPLQDMRWPATCREKVGADGIFCTTKSD